MASKTVFKRYKEWGKRVRGSKKAKRSGFSGRKKLRKSWYEASSGTKHERKETRSERWANA